MSLWIATLVLFVFLAEKCAGEDATVDGCTFSTSEGLGAYDGSRNVSPGAVVPHGTTLTYHCEPLGSRSLWGAKNVTCNDGLWNSEVPYCVSLPEEIPRMDINASRFVVGPRGIVYVEPHTEINVGCSYRTRYEIQALMKGIKRIRHGSEGQLARTSVTFPLEDGERETVKCITPDKTENTVQLVGRRLHRCVLLEKASGMTIKNSGTKAAEVSCSPGYILRGPRLVHCLPLGEWDSKPLCVPLDGVDSGKGGTKQAGSSAQGGNATFEGGKQSHLVTLNSCTVDDTIFQFAHAFLGLQKVEDIRHIPDGVTAVFHCEPVGLTTGHLVSMTCKNGHWTSTGSNRPVSTPLCLPVGEKDIAIKIVGDYTVGPEGVVFVKPGRWLDMTCAYAMESSKNDTTWLLRYYMSGNRRARTVSYIRGKRLFVSLNTSEEVECECRVLNRRRQIKIQGEDLNFCRDPQLSYGLNVLYRNGSKLGFSCKEGMTLSGPGDIECMTTGIWNYSTPYCIEPPVPVSQQGTRLTTQPYKSTTPEPDTTDVQHSGTKATVHSTTSVLPTGGSTSVTEATKGTVTCPAAHFYTSVGPLVVLHSEQRPVSFVENIPAGNALDATCSSPDYIPVGDSGVVTCQQDGTWSFATNLRCATGCHNFAVVDASLIIEGVKERYVLGDSITLSCPNGKRLQPRIERIMCQESSWTWNTLPKCVPVETGDDKQKVSRKGIFRIRPKA